MSRACPVCFKETATTLVESLENCSIHQCTICGLQYVESLPANIPVFDDFTDSAEAFFLSLEAGNRIYVSLTPNERSVLQWLQGHIPANASILELCCESGRFLAALQKYGFKPIGMDPLPRPIAMLGEKGFTVQVGFVEDYPQHWPEPAAVILLESLVRFPAPVEFLRTIYQRFPQAPLCLSVPSPRRSLKVPEFDRRVDYPPHHLTRWTPKAILTALENAGYRGKCEVVHVDIHWRRGSWRLRILKFLFALSLRLIGESEYSIVGIGLPT